MHTRTYHGNRNGGRPIVGYSIATSDGVRWAGGPLIPTRGFDWGNASEASRDLARAVVRDATGSAKLADAVCDDFVQAFVMQWADDWSIKSDEVLAWLAQFPPLQPPDLSDPSYTPTIAEALADPKGFVAGMTETRVVLQCAVRIYHGVRTALGNSVTATERGPVHCDFTGGPAASVTYPLPLESSLAVRRLNPDGFNWGFRGAAADQLALAILLDATNRIRLATLNYDRFSRQFVSTWGDKWEISSMEIVAWLAGIGAFLPRAEEVAHA